jgi:septum formation protein
MPANVEQRLILASASPRRLDLLRQIGITPALIVAAELDESPLPGELPSALAARQARRKGEAVAARHPGAFVLAGDTVVACGRRILPKVDNADQARACLTLLSGRRHRVLGGLCVIAPDGRIATRLVTTQVRFRRLDAAELDAYLAGGEGLGKAGGYAIQGRAAVFVQSLHGSYSNVVGLPLQETELLLRGLGYATF